MDKILVVLQRAFAQARKRVEALPPAVQRGGLYSAILLAAIAGYRYYDRLTRVVATLPPVQQVAFHEGELGGNSLRDGLVESGSTPQQAAAILKVLKNFGGAGRRYKGDRYRIVRSTAGEFEHLTLNRGQQRVIVTLEEGKFKATPSKAPLQIRVSRSSGKVAGSLWVSMMKNGVSDEAIQKYVDVFQWSVDFLTETRDGDRYAMTWVEKRTPDGRIWGRDVTAALYEGHVAGKQIGILFDDAYYDAKGNSLERIFLRAPLNYRRISSTFSTGRWHPILKKRRPHFGIDYAAGRGTPVSAIGSGRVTEVGYSGGYGKRIEIRHNSVYASLYGHLQGYAAGIHPGASVRQGQVIGYVGSTGLATGPHLHFQFSKNGTWVNFASLKLPKASSVSGPKLSLFNAERDRALKDLGEEPAGGGGGAR